MQQLHALTEGESKSQVCLSAAESHKKAFVSPWNVFFLLSMGYGG